jgi:hypothetical protein
MAHQYGTTLGVVRCAIPAVLMGAFAGVAPGQSATAPQPGPDRTTLWQTQASSRIADVQAQSTDDWDRVIIDFLQILCTFFGCGGTAPTGESMSELEDVVAAFVAMSAGAVVPAGCDPGEIEYHLSVASQARLINGTYPAVPPHLAQPLDNALARIEAVLQAALDSLPEVAN